MVKKRRKQPKTLSGIETFGSIHQRRRQEERGYSSPDSWLLTPSEPETSLLPTLVTAQVVVIDNLTLDKSGRIQELIQTAGCRLLYLPPYSPEFNKIEQRRVLAKKSNSQTAWWVWLLTFWRALDVLPCVLTRAVAICDFPDYSVEKTSKLWPIKQLLHSYSAPSKSEIYP